MRARATWILVLVIAVVACGPTPRELDAGGDDDGDGDVADAPADGPTDGPDVDTPVIDAPVIDAPAIDAPAIDAAIDATVDATVDAPTDAPTDVAIDAATDAQLCPDHTCTTPVADGCVAAEVCNNGSDDNCNGTVDEGCTCTPGAVQPCFRGPPGRRHVGSCVDGMQTCQVAGQFGVWGACVGGIAPGAEACDSADNNCNGCADDDPACCIVTLACPSSMPDGAPFQNYVIDGTQFFSGPVASWSWDVTGGPCDRLFLTTTSPLRQSYTLTGTNTSMLTLRPTLSGDYTVHVRIVEVGGAIHDCTFIVHIAGPGLRVEMCSDRTGTTDIDLHLHRPGTTTDWFTSADDCYYGNCKAGSFGPPNWGYANSPLSECVGGPEGAQWQTVGSCRNPRLDIDSISANGVPENINVDNPLNGQTFRVMAHYYSGTGVAHPMVNVYCGGYLRGSYGAAPDVLTTFDLSGPTTGDIWRVVDASVQVNGAGVTTNCFLNPLHPPGMMTGYWVTNTRAY